MKKSFELFKAGHVHVSKNLYYSKYFTADFFLLKMVFIEKAHISAKETAKICHIHNPVYFASKETIK